MKLLEQILNCSDDEIEKIITDAISKCNDKTDKVDMIGFLPNLKTIHGLSIQKPGWKIIV